jgi:hypothetical protein
LARSCIKFCNRKAGFATARQFHGDPVSGKAVSWVKRENLFQSCNFIHLACDPGRFLSIGPRGICGFGADCRNWNKKDVQEFRTEAAAGCILTGER